MLLCKPCIYCYYKVYVKTKLRRIAAPRVAGKTAMEYALLLVGSGLAYVPSDGWLPIPGGAFEGGITM
jgi:hypothetical protein